MRRPGDDRGATALEFALTIPVILALMFGILQYGYHYWALETASATAREAVRKYSVGTEEACTIELARAHAGTAALGPVTVSSAPSDPSVGAVIEVTVSFQSLYLGFLPLPADGVVSETASARVENVPVTPAPC